jgi:hypothetical protein
MTSVATVKRKDLARAVSDFIALDEPRTVARPGQRPEIEPGYFWRWSKRGLIRAGSGCGPLIDRTIYLDRPGFQSNLRC